MRSLELALQGGGKVLLAGLAFGAGLPVLYALAIRSLSLGARETVDADGRARLVPSVAGRALAVILGLILVGAVVLGITMIVASGLGKMVSFDHLIPIIVEK